MAARGPILGGHRFKRPQIARMFAVVVVRRPARLDQPAAIVHHALGHHLAFGRSVGIPCNKCGAYAHPFGCSNRGNGEGSLETGCGAFMPLLGHDGDASGLRSTAGDEGP